MAKFLTTRGVSHHLEELITSANSSIILVSPYVQFPPTIYDRLQHAAKRGVSITLIYGKKKLNLKESNSLKELKCKVCFKNNLHAKCYANENMALITSLNLYAFSELNNEEMGVLLEKEIDVHAYADCLRTMTFYEGSSEVESPGYHNNKKEDPSSHQTKHEKVEKEHAQTQHENNDIQSELFQRKWFEWIKSSFPHVVFQESGTTISAKNFLKKGWEISIKYRVIILNLNTAKEMGRELKNAYYQQFLSDLSDYTLYWNSPYNKLFLYPGNGKEFGSIEEDVFYLGLGFNSLISCLRRAGLL